MAIKTPDQRALPKPNPQMSREDAWAIVVENDGLVRWVLNQFVNRICSGTGDGRYFGYSREDMFAELLPAAYESALVAVESFDASKGFTLSTYAEKVMWRDLTDELVRWRSNTAIDNDEVFSLDAVDEETEYLEQSVAVEDPNLEAVEDRVDAEATFAKVQAALTDREFAAIALTAEGFSPKEIARRLSVSEGNARVILHRARTKAQAALA